jgi:hypothetical protein
MARSRGTRRRLGLLTAALLTAPLLAACGSDDSTKTSPAAKASSSDASGETGATTSRPEPSGSLTPEEYRLLHSVFSKVERADKSSKPTKTIRVFEAACGEFADGPTPLIRTIATDCLASARFLQELLELPKKVRPCNAPTQPVSTASCMSGPLQGIVAKTRAAIESSKATNRALDERKIRGRCRKAIGTSKRDLRIGSRIATTADQFDKAIQNGNLTEIRHASTKFQSAVIAFTDSPSGSLVKLLRSCRR